MDTARHGLLAFFATVALAVIVMAGMFALTFGTSPEVSSRENARPTTMKAGDGTGKVEARPTSDGPRPATVTPRDLTGRYDSYRNKVVRVRGRFSTHVIKPPTMIVYLGGKNEIECFFSENDASDFLGASGEVVIEGTVSNRSASTNQVELRRCRRVFD